MLQMLFSTILALFFPKKCFGCCIESYSLCGKCISQTKKSITSPHTSYKSYYSFKDPLIRRSIHAIKYFQRKDLIEPLTKATIPLVESIFEENPPMNRENTLFIPIPMLRIRKYIRGYNQAEIIASILSKEMHTHYTTKLLICNKHKKRQVTTTSRNERIINLRNSFIAPYDVSKYHIILVDDVITTGATIDEAMRTLMKKGAKSVYAITLAH